MVFKETCSNHVFLVLKIPQLDAELQVGSHEGRVEVENHLLCPSNHTLDAAQDTVGFPGCKSTLLAPVFHLPVSPTPSLQGCSKAILLSACFDTGDCSNSGALLNFLRFKGSPLYTYLFTLSKSFQS